MTREPRRVIFLLIVICILMVASLSYSASEEISSMPSKNEGGSNVPLITSMDSLDHSIRDIVSATIVGDGKRTLAALDPVYGTMDLVYAAIKSGTVILKRNAEKQAEFRGLQEEFQSHLQKLRDAAKNNNWELMTAQTKGIIDNCVRCHQEFK